MLSTLIRNGFGKKEAFNCAEKILYGANKAYNLGLDKESLKLFPGFGGGMGVEPIFLDVTELFYRHLKF